MAQSDAISYTHTVDQNVVGIHVIAELSGCNEALLNDAPFLEALINRAAVSGNGKVLQTVSHAFEPQGVTALALLAESHISIHTWPELGYAAVDAFTCGQHANPRESVSVIVRELKAADATIKEVRRGSINE